MKIKTHGAAVRQSTIPRQQQGTTPRAATERSVYILYLNILRREQEVRRSNFHRRVEASHFGANRLQLRFPCDLRSREFEPTPSNLQIDFGDSICGKLRG